MANVLCGDHAGFLLLQLGPCVSSCGSHIAVEDCVAAQQGLLILQQEGSAGSMCVLVYRPVYPHGRNISTYLRGTGWGDVFYRGGPGAWIPGVLGLGSRVRDWVSRVRGQDSGVFSSGASIPSSLAPGSSEVGGFSPPLSV